MVAVALFSAFIAMRLAIHGREVLVPNLAGLTVDEASTLARREGVALNLENRFYSTDVPAGHILAQDPPRRRPRPPRVAGPPSPNPSARSASPSPTLPASPSAPPPSPSAAFTLDLGAVAHLALPGDAGVVAAQTPPSNAGGVDGPRVSLLISDPIAPADPRSPAGLSSFDPNADAQPAAYVMPSLIGLTYSAASVRAAATGLRLLVAVPDTPAPTPTADATPAPALGNPTNPAPAPSAPTPPPRPTRTPPPPVSPPLALPATS